MARENRNEKFEGFAPLHAACHRGHIDLALLLIDARADVNSRGVWHAVKGGDLREGKSDLSDVTPLHLAIARNHSKLAERLLKHHGAVASLYEGGKRWPGERLKQTDEFDRNGEDYWTRHERERHEREQRAHKDKEDLTCTLVLAASNSATDHGRVLRAVSEAARQLAAERGPGAADGDLCTVLLLAALAGGCRSTLGIMLDSGVQPQTEASAELLLTAAVMHDSRAASGSSSAVRLQPGMLLQRLVAKLKPKPLAESQAAEQSAQSARSKSSAAKGCFTALHAAALVGSVGAIAALAKVTCLEEPPVSRFDQPDRDGFTPSQYAAMGRFRVIESDNALRDSDPARMGFAFQHFSWIGAPTSDRTRSGAKRERAARPQASMAACSDRGQASAEVLHTLLRNVGSTRCVDRGRLQGYSLLELAVQARRDKVVTELLQPSGGNLCHRNRREHVENALTVVREQISSGTARAVSLNPLMHRFYDPEERVEKAVHPGELLRLSNADVTVARDIEGMLVRELGTIGKRKRET